MYKTRINKKNNYKYVVIPAIKRMIEVEKNHLNLLEKLEISEFKLNFICQSKSILVDLQNKLEDANKRVS